MKRTRLHLTAFGPFLDVVDNPSSRIAKELIPTLPPCVELVSFHELEVSIRGVDSYFGSEVSELVHQRNESGEERDGSIDVFLHLGVHRGARGEMRLEVRGRNEAHFPDGDMVGQVKDHAPIDESLPVGSFLESQLDQQFLSEVAGAVTAATTAEESRLKPNVSVTFDAGAYLCNYCLYRSVQNTTIVNSTSDSASRKCISLFIHVLDPERSGEGPQGVQLPNPTISKQAAVIACLVEKIAEHVQSASK